MERGWKPVIIILGEIHAEKWLRVALAPADDPASYTFDLPPPGATILCDRNTRKNDNLSFLLTISRVKWALKSRERHKTP